MRPLIRTGGMSRSVASVFDTVVRLHQHGRTSGSRVPWGGVGGGQDRRHGGARVRAPALLCWTRDSSSRTRKIHATDSGDRHTCTLAHTHTERRGQTSTCESAHVREHDGQRQGLPALMYGVTARWSASCPHVDCTDDSVRYAFDVSGGWHARFHTQKTTERFDSETCRLFDRAADGCRGRDASSRALGCR